MSHRNKTHRAILSAGNDTGDKAISGVWSCDVEFSAIASRPAAPLDVAPSSRAAVGADGQAAGTDGGAHAKLDVPDSQGGKLSPGQRGHAIDGKDGKAPVPHFGISAYNGGPMRLAGYKFPVVIRASGARAAAPLIPMYVAHLPESASGAEMMETLVGQAPLTVADHKITACGDITGASKTVALMMEHAKQGFKFQASIHGNPVQLSHIRDGTSQEVNGRMVAGPVDVADESVIDHIAILPLGADTTTSAHIAASHAAGDLHMEEFAWIKANYGLDQAAFLALPTEVQTTISAAFDVAVQSSDPSKDPASAKPKPKPIAASGAVPDTEGAIKAQNDAIAANMDRVAKINDLAKDHPAIAAQAVREGWTVERTENGVLKAQRDALTVSAFGAVGVNTGNAARQKAYSPRVIEAATLLSCGYSGDRLVADRQYGADVLNLTDDFARMERTRVITPSKLARIIARFNGVNLPDGHGDDFWGDALANERLCPRGGERISAGYAAMSGEFSTMSLPAALSNVMNKFLIDGYVSVDRNDADPALGVAWKQFCRVSSVQDFKPHFRIRMVASALLQRLLKGGEIQMGSVGEQSYQLTADTKAVMLGVNRKDLVNDDMSVLSTLPTHFGVGAARTVANDIYECLAANLQSDGATAFFTSSAITTPGNLMGANLTASAQLSFATLEAARARFATQTDPTGQPAGIAGTVLLVPPNLTGMARQLCESDMLIANFIAANSTGSQRGTPANNTLKNLQKPVSSAYLANGTIKADGTTRAGSSTTWYLTAPATEAQYPVEIGFLNGAEMPTIERAEADFTRLGILFRTFLDYGVAMGEPRSAQKQTQ